MSTFPKTINKIPEGFFASIETLDPQARKQPAILTARRESKGKFESLMRGEWQGLGYPSHSEADEGLCGILVHKVGPNVELIDRVFRSSGLMRDKWDEVHGAQTYGQATIARVLKNYSVEEIPEGVDLNAADDFSEEPGKRLLFPVGCLYGKAGELARKTETDPGYSYLSVLVMAAGRGIEPHPQVRPTLYGATLGDVGWGKSLAMQRAGALLGFPTEASACIERFPESYEPDGNRSLFLQLNLSSDRGLYKAFEGEKTAKPAIIAVDELRNLLAKSNIENSCLFTVLCSLYNLDEAGYADKKTKDFIRVRLSILGCLKVADENEFPEVFTQATSSGFYDRMLFGVAGKRVVWKPWNPGVYQHVEFSQPEIHEWVFKALGECFGSKGNRFLENALRVAYISAAINGDKEIGLECTLRVLKFMEWQERIRGVFRPAKGANEHQECVDTVIQAFREAPGRAANWSKLARKKRWDRKFPRSLASVKRLLEDMGRLTKDKETGKHFLREESMSTTLEELRRPYRLERVRLSLRNRIASNKSVYLLALKQENLWATDTEWNAIVDEIVASGYALRAKGRNGGEKLVLA